jgi:hypothetical protein
MTARAQEAAANDAAILRELTALVRETFLLWDEIWVGFSWRHYYFDHTQRVRALCRAIGGQEGANLRKLEYAAILHDITKRYDGPILLDSQGKRVLDENGFWLNELLMPKRENVVTRLYQAHNQFHKLHNVSGAVIAHQVLAAYELPPAFCASISSIIRSHLRPNGSQDESSEDRLEKTILYEADTIDANVGLTAFYRNIHIRTHRAPPQPDAAAVQRYVSTMEPWIDQKAAFLDQITTKTGRQIAQRRLERMKEVHAQLLDELENHRQASLEYGLLGVVKSFMGQNTDPDLEKELNQLVSEQALRCEMMKGRTNPETQALVQRAITFCQLLTQETTGQA